MKSWTIATCEDGPQCLIKNLENSKQLRNAIIKRHASFSLPINFSTNPANEMKANTLIRADKRITLDELASELGVSHGSAQNIVD